MTTAPVPPETRPLSRAKRKIFADLGTRNGRERRGLFRLEGPRSIEDAMKRGARFRYLVVSADGEAHVARWIDEELLDADAEVYRVSGSELAAIADTATPQGVVAIGPLPTLTQDALPADLGRLILLVDGVQDPGNLGTLLRTLAAVGGRTALLCRGAVDAYNPKALRGAAGATFDLAIGNEATGLDAEIRHHAALVVGLPMAPYVDSLSAAVAGSVALYALTHRLRPA